MIELIKMAEKNTVMTINYVFFVFWNISFKVCNNACIMPRFGKNHFHPFLLSVSKMNDTVNFEDSFLYIFSAYQTIIFHSKYVILIALSLVLTYCLVEIPDHNLRTIASPPSI